MTDSKSLGNAVWKVLIAVELTLTGLLLLAWLVKYAGVLS